MFNCKKIAMKIRQKNSTFEVEYNIEEYLYGGKICNGTALNLFVTIG